MANFIPNLNKIRDGANFLADYVRNAFEAVQAKFPITKENIASVFGSVIDWTGAPTLPTEIIPWSDQPIATSGISAWGNCIDILRDCVCQYRDDDSLYFGPGFILHRGNYKRQSCNDDGSWVSATAASLVIPDECPVPTGTTTGLVADSWYYVYAKLDAAGEGPEYRISLVPPDRCDGYGPEHPSYDALRFLGSFRTGAAPTAAIRPFHRYHLGRVFWREIMVGPEDPTENFNIDSATYFTQDVTTECPPSAQGIFLTLRADAENGVWVRTTGDAQDPAGYYIQSPGSGSVPIENTWLELPVCVMDSTTGAPSVEVEIDTYSNSSNSVVAVAGYVEALL